MNTKNNKIARRYVKALFELAEESGSLKKVHGELDAVATLLGSSPDLKSFIGSTNLPVAVRKSVLKELFETRVSKLTYTFLVFLVDQHRLECLSEICHAFDVAFLEASETLRADVASAAPLNDKQESAIAEKFSKVFDRKIAVSRSVDPQLLGGFKVKIKDIVFDLSLQTQLSHFKRMILNA